MPDNVSIDVWSYPLDVTVEELAARYDLLSIDERKRADRFVFDRDRTKFVAGRGRLREILSYYSSTPAHLLEFEYGDQGKPRLHGLFPDLHFNVSHSATMAAVAISPTVPVGIDIEEIRPLKEDIASRFFSSTECEALDDLEPSDRLAGFYRCWTRKEAFIKAIGVGLSLPLDSFDVSVGPDETAKLLRFDGEPDAGRKWMLLGYSPHPGFAGAIAAPANGRAIELKYLTSAYGGVPTAKSLTGLLRM